MQFYLILKEEESLMLELMKVILIKVILILISVNLSILVLIWKKCLVEVEDLVVDSQVKVVDMVEEEEVISLQCNIIFAFFRCLYYLLERGGRTENQVTYSK